MNSAHLYCIFCTNCEWICGWSAGRRAAWKQRQLKEGAKRKNVNHPLWHKNVLAFWPWAWVLFPHLFLICHLFHFPCQTILQLTISQGQQAIHDVQYKWTIFCSFSSLFFNYPTLYPPILVLRPFKYLPLLPPLQLRVTQTSANYFALQTFLAWLGPSETHITIVFFLLWTPSNLSVSVW